MGGKKVALPAEHNALVHQQCEASERGETREAEGGSLVAWMSSSGEAEK